MKERQLIYILLILQVTTFVPFVYDKKRKQFQNSKWLTIYCVITNVIIEIIFYYYLIAWLKHLHFLPIVHLPDLIYLTIEYAAISIQLVYHLKFYIFDSENMRIIANKFLRCFKLHRDFSIDNFFLARVFILIIFEFILLPGIMLVNTYLSFMNRNLEEFAISTVVLWCCVIYNLSAGFSFNLMLYLISYFLNNLNNKIEKLLNNKINADDELQNEIKNAVSIYISLSNLMSQLSNIYCVYIIIALIVTTLNAVWECYRLIGRYTFQLVSEELLGGNVLFIVDFFCNFLYFIKNIHLLCFFAENISNECQRFEYFLYDLNNLVKYSDVSNNK